LAITQIAHIARRGAQHDRLPYAGEASKRLAHLVNALSEAATRYEALGGEFQAFIESQHDLTFQGEPLILHSLLTTERPTVKKVLQAERLVLLLKAVAESATRVRDQLQNAGTPSQLSSPLPTNLPRKVRDAVRQAVRQNRRPFGNRFPATGYPKRKSSARRSRAYGDSIVGKWGQALLS